MPLKHLRTQKPMVFAILVAFMGIVGCKELGLYEQIPQFDKVMHALGGLAMAWLGLSLMQSDITRMTPWKQALILVSFGAFVGVIWEIAEFVSGQGRDLWPTLYSYFHGGDLADSLCDLVADMAGSLAFAAWALRKERR